MITSLFKNSILAQVKEIVSRNLGRKDWIHVIFLRWDSKQSSWCFDIPIMGIENEPFISGMDDIIDKQLILAKKLDEAKKRGVCVLFSGATNKPESFKSGYYFFIKKQREENGGCWYYEPKSKYEGWLCPNLYQFFSRAPDTIHICVRD